MYFDFVKNKYDDKPESERTAYIARDKKALAEIIQSKIAGEAEQIVERWYELDDVGYISINEKFLDLLREAEQLYYFAFYTGTIAIVGIACEEYCKFLMNTHGGRTVKTQYERIDTLYEMQVIELAQKEQLHQVRKIRNECMHYNISFKNLSTECLKHSAFEMLTLYKTCLLPLTEDVDEQAESEIIHDYAKSKEKVFREYVLKHRNVLKNTQGIDLQVSPHVKYMKVESLYYIAEIDTETDAFKEMTLVDLNCENPAMVIVDLTLPQAEMMKEQKINEGNIMRAALVGSVSTIGQTEEWSLLNIEDVCRISMKLEDLGDFLSF